MGSSVSDAGDVDGGQPTHAHAVGVRAPASDSGSAALQVAKGITVTALKKMRPSLQ